MYFFLCDLVLMILKHFLHLYFQFCEQRVNFYVSYFAGFLCNSNSECVNGENRGVSFPLQKESSASS